MSPLLQRPFSASRSGRASIPVPEDSIRKVDDVPEGILTKIRTNAWVRYPLLPLESRAVLFRAQESGGAYLYRVHADLGWGDRFNHGLRIVEVPGDHFTLLKDPQVSTLAQGIRDCLEELSPQFQQPRKTPPPHQENQPTPFVR
jgi:hypothetical protein